MTNPICYACGKRADCRPYGPRGEQVCFDCAFATPEAKRTTDAAFRSQLEACGDAILIGLKCGPVPLFPIKRKLQ